MIRDAVAADGPALTAIVRQSQAYEGSYQEMVRGISVLPESLPSNITRLCEDAGAAAGFYVLLCRDGDCELDLMFVANGRTRTGIGRALFIDMARAARARGYAEVLIVSHPPAAGFYERMGARRSGVEPPGGHASWERPRFRYALA